MAKHSILVVDTDKSILDLVRRSLSSDGYKVEVAGSSDEAVDVARLVEPNLLVINPIMPIRSGIETAKEISRAVGAKVLFLSDSYCSQLIRRARERSPPTSLTRLRLPGLSVTLPFINLL